MYAPRRAAATDIAETDETVGDHAFAVTGKARRIAPTWRESIARRAGIGFVIVAAAASTSGFVFGSGQVPATVAEPIASPVGRDVEVVSRQADRALQVRPLTSSSLAETLDDLTSYTPLYTKAKLNLRAEASEDSKLLGSVGAGEAVLGTTTVEGKYRKVEVGDTTGWVLAAQLTSASTEYAGISEAPCDRGSSIEKKLRADTIRIYRSVCALFPGINSYGGWRAGGREYHKNGRAIDMMLTPTKESAMGWKIAEYLVKNAKAFNIDHIIFEQKIWTPRSPHWRKMADRGSITQNHYDHVHVAVKA